MLLHTCIVGFQDNHDSSKVHIFIKFSDFVMGEKRFVGTMLPDTLHKLPQAERFAYAKLLAHITRIDGELTVEEMAMFEQRLGTALLSPGQRKEIRGVLKSPPSLQECLDGLGSESGRLALRDSVLMSAADGHVDEDEREVLEKIAAHLGLDESAIDQLLEWVVRGYSWMQDGYDILNKLS